MINDRQIRRLFRAAKAGLIVLLLYAVVGTVMRPFRLNGAHKPSAAVGGEQLSPPVADTTDSESPADYSAIVRNDLFTGGSAAAGSTISQATETMRSAEELGLKLVGVIAAAGNPAISRANITSDQSHSPLTCKIGDVVASARIESIEPDRVILTCAGQKCMLVLHTATTEKPTGPAENTAAKTISMESAPTGSESVGQTSSRLSYVENIFRKATMETHMQNGRTGGLKITGLEQTPLAATFGLRNGDIIRAVNGQDLTSKQKAFQVLQKARTQSKLDIELLRGDKTKNLSFDL